MGSLAELARKLETGLTSVTQSVGMQSRTTTELRGTLRFADVPESPGHSNGHSNGEAERAVERT